jgi:enediyne polyketide synthase
MAGHLQQSGSGSTGGSIAIVGMACVYPDARSPGELWENVLAQRRAFRRLPPERLNREDYFSTDPHTPDATYATEAAVIEGYEFDRVAFRVVGSTFRAADLAHWLALDVASRALADAGFADGHGLPREATGVLLGNTLTGEFSRANTLRLRWPYVRRTLEAALVKENWSAEQREKFLAGLEEKYKAPFPPVGEETLAGGLSNTIAGRICNQFNLKGGGYTVDGACASSLLATANACSALVAGDLDIAMAGGVDLSLDPFEIVGFAKTGALAPDEMRVFDKRSAGFWPGEGCGMVVLMRHDDALAQGRRVYAVIRGWGISSDGSGGMTRPESDGQIEALRRAYRRAGFGIETVSYCEGHGTGTAVGDATELEVLSRARRESKINFPPAAIGSIKANIGHTKAAAGIAGLIKATMAVHTQVLPPTTGCEQPHPQLIGPSPALRVLREAEPWPQNRPLRASVSAMGFGGINAHVVLESVVSERRAMFSPHEHSLSRSSQDAELFLLAAETAEQLALQVEKLLTLAARLSRAELADLAAQLEKNLERGPVRAAIVASKPEQFAARLQTLKSWMQNGVAACTDFSAGVFLGAGGAAPRIAFLFPGQGSPTHLDGGVWRRRFESVRELYSRAELPADGDSVSTRVVQPAVVTASLAALRVLNDLGVRTDAAIGHSLGEITALHWAKAFDEETLLRIARIRGAAMADLGSPTGAMLAVAAPWQEVQALLTGEPLAIVGYNSPRQTVIAGEAGAVKNLARRAASLGLHTSLLPVSHAFHTPLVAAAVPVLAAQLAREKISELEQNVFSTVTGARLEAGEDLRSLLCRQVTSPVRFESALAALLNSWSSHFRVSSDAGKKPRPQNSDKPELELQPAHGIDLLIEAGPGAILSGLVRDAASAPVVSVDAGGNSLQGLLSAVGAAFALGAPVKTAALFADRFTRPFNLDWKPKFFANPCEQAPVSEPSERRSPTQRDPELEPVPQRAGSETGAPIELIRGLVAARAELPASAVRDESRMLSDLHLNSITVGQLVSEAAKQLGLPRIVGLTDFANASVAEIARALEELKRTGGAARKDDQHQPPSGVDNWVRTFTVELVETKSRSRRADQETGVPGRWQIFAPKDHPLAGPLREAFGQTNTNGVVVCLPENPGAKNISLLLDAGHAALAQWESPRFVVVQHGWGGGGFARTLHLENPAVETCVVNVPASHPPAVEWIVAEALAANGFTEVHFTGDGRRLEPRLVLMPQGASESSSSSFSSSSSKLFAEKSRTRTKDEDEDEMTTGFSVGPADVLLVTGGGKGIAAECALAFARETGVKLALLGRSDPKLDKELANNLARVAAAGVRFNYVRADVTEADAVRAAVAEIERRLGQVTAILHGAGVNTPQLIGALDEAAFRRTVLPKISGARNVLAAVDAKKLRLFVTFGSIIARTGLPGEADYATANEWLAALTNEFQTQHPRCRCLALEWSVWSGAGMGERLGRIESLVQQGIMPITLDEGVRTFCELLRSLGAPASCRRGGGENQKHAGKMPALPETSLVVTGRFGEPPTLKLLEPELPLRRFLERKRVFYPGVELVVDAELSLRADPYLADHVMQKQSLLPAVLGLEAMAQAAMALAGSADTPVFENVGFSKPVAVSEKATVTIRLAALQREPGVIEVCLRSEETDFQVDHFRAVCRFGAPDETTVPRLSLSPFESVHLALDPQKDLYGRILFHRGRFCRLRGYRLLQAKECVAEITADDGAVWFGPYLPADFVLGNPAARDAALHAIQACIPHQRILPTGIERMVIHLSDPGAHFVRAKERSRDGNNFVYDVEVTDARGEVIERWDGLRLRAVEVMGAPEAWPDALLGPYLERRLEELADAGTPVKVALERGLREKRPARSDAVIQQALGRPARIWRRPDGKPVFDGEEGISAAHALDFTFAVASAGGTACDLEEVAARTDAVWCDLLGKEKFKLAERIALERAESVDAAATRLWTALECLKKIGQPAMSPLVLESSTDDGWARLRSGLVTIMTCVTAVRGMKSPLGMAVAFEPVAENQPPSISAKNGG